jgi:hypothetical protein
MLLARGHLASFAESIRQGSYREPDEASHEAHGRVLTWLASHPLSDVAFERLLLARIDGVAPEAVRVVCRQLQASWQDAAIRRWWVARGLAVVELPEWPAW